MHSFVSIRYIYSQLYNYDLSSFGFCTAVAKVRSELVQLIIFAFVRFHTGCASDQFRCRDGNCVSQDDVCNGIRQCMDGSDEENCDILQCQHNQFRCRNGQCVSLTARCNGKTDCQDSSDESNCGK